MVWRVDAFHRWPAVLRVRLVPASVTLSQWRGRDSVAERFAAKALARHREVDPMRVAPYVVRLLEKTEAALRQEDPRRRAEDSLRYGSLLRDYVRTLRPAAERVS